MRVDVQFNFSAKFLGLWINKLFLDEKTVFSFELSWNC